MKTKQIVTVALAIGAIIGTGKAQEQIIMTINGKPIKNQNLRQFIIKTTGRK
jgi:hypothetical protein